MRTRSNSNIGKLALACAATALLGLGTQAALADTPSASVSGSSADTMTQQGALPPEQHSGKISFVSGGIGSDQSAAFKTAEHRYPLSLEFAGQTKDGNIYLADVPVRIKDAHGNTVLDAHANGPYMLISLPDGRYVVSADHNGTTERHTVQVSRSTHAHQMFFWAKAKQ